MLAATNAGAQDPKRLPGVVVNAEAPGPGPKLLVGTVKDTSGIPIEGAEVSIGILQKRVFTKEDGSFRIDDVKGGTWAVRVRKIGFAPQRKELKMEKDGARAEIELVPWLFSLPAVITSSARGGLSGIIADTSFSGVPDVEVKVLGKSRMVAMTDSGGGFFIPVPAGSYMVSMKKKGFADRLASVTIPDDSGKFMRASIYPYLPIPVREAWNMRDLQSRQAWRNKITQPFYTHDDIVKMGYTWIYDLVVIKGMDQWNPACHAIINGGPGTAELSSLTVDEVEAVELYQSNRFRGPVHSPRPTTSIMAGASKPMPRTPSLSLVPLTNTEEAAILNMRLSCPLVYVWTR